MTGLSAETARSRNLKFGWALHGSRRVSIKKRFRNAILLKVSFYDKKWGPIISKRQFVLLNRMLSDENCCRNRSLSIIINLITETWAKSPQQRLPTAVWPWLRKCGIDNGQMTGLSAETARRRNLKYCWALHGCRGAWIKKNFEMRFSLRSHTMMREDAQLFRNIDLCFWIECFQTNIVAEIDRCR